MSFIIAEAGISHNGDLKLAKRLVNVAKNVGADAVKFQTFYDFGRLKEYELNKSEFIELKKYCDKMEIMFLTTPHTLEVIDFVDTLVPIHKIASPFLTNKEFILKIASKNKPILLSTGSLVHKSGMATMGEIKRTLSWIPKADVTLLHCVSKYPCFNPRLNRIKRLKRFKRVVGLSDHTKNIHIPPFPVIEKHLMLNGNCIDKDVSLNPVEFLQMVQYIRENENIRS